ncbi:hypothetical protein JOQ06_017041 [Pogonophryne albipinna]|uniref:Uncharacterized protein n=1 Tax=Pogonophryne albipinna TaxID=1090488 RepID=A0AAD6FJA5_9TELE|nr:hypothetical protein JOQ06_017041 [Pogonophryne albipinna]
MSWSTRNKSPNKQDISKEKTDKQRRPASPASASLKTDSNMCESVHEVTLLEELGKLRKENQEGHNQTKMSLDRLEQTVLDIKVQKGQHEGRIGKLEDRVGMAEDVAMRHQRVLRYLIHLSTTCDDLQNRLRRNNVRIFQNGDDDEDNEEVLDKDTLYRDQVVKGAIEVQTREYAIELNAPSQDPDSQPRKKKEEEDINAMEMEVDKRDLISREISKFRDTHKKPEERERSRDVSEGRSRSRERTREDKKRDREEDEEDVYERRRLERRLRDKEAAYQERLKNWEIRERKKARDYSKETEREDERRQEMMKEAKRLKEFLEDYDDDRDDPKYYRGSALQKRLLDREKETELDERDGPPTQTAPAVHGQLHIH